MLSTLPKQLLELKRSATRQGAMAALSRCLAYAPELTTEEMAAGFPAKKVDGSDFSEANYVKCMKGSRVLASSLVNELDLTIYQAAYNAEKKRVQCPTFEARNLAPARRKQLFAPGLDASHFFAQAQFEALTRCNWDVDNLQIQEDEEPAKDDEPGRCTFN